MSGILTIILKIITIVFFILLPVAAAFVYKRFKGYARYMQGVSLALQAIQAIVAWFKENPGAQKTAEVIYNLFKERLESVLPFTDAEVAFLFDQIEVALAALLGVDVSIFAALKKQQATAITKKAPKLFGRRRNYLFA